MNANLKTIFLTIILFVSVFLGGCSSRIVYEQPKVRSTERALNINIASAGELEKLPHIGHKTAETIVAFREENGPFRRVEHLMLIKGVSEKRFAELRPYLRTE
jgi:competence ComEA-like helix-hairpin-helix protein